MRLFYLALIQVVITGSAIGGYFPFDKELLFVLLFFQLVLLLFAVPQHQPPAVVDQKDADYPRGLREKYEVTQAKVAALEAALKDSEKRSLSKSDTSSETRAEVVGFLSTLQAKGRFLDFIMEDITKFEDAQVGAVARFVHQGCKLVIEQSFNLSPVSEVDEGKLITVSKDASPVEYRLTGKLVGDPPFQGTVVHRGWKTEKVEVPRITTFANGNVKGYVVTPAEIEIVGK